MLSSRHYLLALSLIGTAFSTKTCWRVPGIQTFSGPPQPGPVNGQFTSCLNGFDGPMVDGMNATTYDNWYFDAIGIDGVSSLVVMFMLEGDRSGLTINKSFSKPEFVQISGTFANATSFVNVLFADLATVSAVEDGSSGTWNGTGALWVGSHDARNYRVTLDAPELGFEGTFTLRSIAPPHYPCSPKIPNQSLEVLPGVGWANAIPDADAVVDVTIHGSPLKFVGTGYHDKYWGVTPFKNSVGSWYWGHARTGAYSIVWLNGLSPNKTEYASGYVAYNGQLVHAACGKMKIRPMGVNSTYPPTSTSGAPEGLYIEGDLGDHGVLKADVVTYLHTIATRGYGRWIGYVNGTVDGDEHKGVAGYEIFSFF